MGKFKNSPSSYKQQIALPNYRLDSNLVLLPGIIYNVTFSRFKTAALLSRFKKQVGHVPLIENLLNEYDFAGEESSSESSLSDDLPGVLSDESIKGIKQFYEYEQSYKSNQDPRKLNDEPQSEFDWLVLAISPNLNKIKDPNGFDLTEEYNDIVTVVRIVGIVDDTTNIKITLQALTRGRKITKTSQKIKPNEVSLDIDWNGTIENISTKYTELTNNIKQLFKSIDSFIVDYRKALNIASNNNAKNPKAKEKDLLTLNPLANALYLQLAGSKDFTKAYISLQKLIGNFSIGAKNDMSLDNKNFARIIDLISAIIPFPNHEKLKVLNQTEINDRVNHVNTMMGKLVAVFDSLKDNTDVINHWFYNEATNIQRANVVANQLKSIRLVLEGITNQSKTNSTSFNNNSSNNNNKKLIRRKNNNASAKDSNNEDDNNDNFDDDDESGDDELKLITNFIKHKLPHITTLDEDSKRLIIKDYKRVKNSPPGNSDFHVLRNYLEIVSDLPWDKFIGKFDSNKDIDIKFAKEQLDKDHYGLEHVKSRLIQYLVVLKLLGINADIEYENQQKSIKSSDDKKQQLEKEEIERKKFTNEKYSNESIIIPNNDETSVAHRQANNENKRLKDLTNEVIKRKQEKQENMKRQIISKLNRSPIIMLAGPPGVGKTSLAKSIANVLGRQFQRVSLGGIKDELEIRGHRRTYVGAMPGVIVQSLRKSRSMNPVILLDEIDKVVGGGPGAGGSKVNGDPAAALLEVLDPEQNGNFTDHYLGFPVDLSQVMFICTANEPHNLSRPLLDRLEMIELGAYDYSEKLMIGSRYLLPRQMKRNGLINEASRIEIPNKVMKQIILEYTREAGVRNFERNLGTICRHKAVEYAESLTNDHEYNGLIDEYDLSKYLGIPYPKMSEIYEAPVGTYKYGVVNGLSYNSDGSGSVLLFESIGINKNNTEGPWLNMTGRLGEVLMESGKIGLTFIKLIIYKNLLNLTNDEHELEDIINRMQSLDIHMHVPSGSIEKDGPSAGITMALLFLSLILEKPVESNIAMTGEITLRGLVLPIGGLKEKMLGASLSGIKKMIVPRENRKDIIKEYIKSINQPEKLNELLKDDYKDGRLSEVEEYVMNKYGIEVVYAKDFWDVIKGVWGDLLLVKVDQRKMTEYHL